MRAEYTRGDYTANLRFEEVEGPFAVHAQEVGYVPGSEGDDYLRWKNFEALIENVTTLQVSAYIHRFNILVPKILKNILHLKLCQHFMNWLFFPDIFKHIFGARRA